MTGTPELRHLRAFVALSEELHFSRAARKLHVAQQALSAQIRQLEQDLGVQLFHRTTRKVELTQAGRTLLSHALPILSAVTTACEETRRAYSGEVGLLSVAYTPTVAAEALPKIVLELHRRHPDIRLRMCEMWQAESVAGVNQARFDVGLARCPQLTGDLCCVNIRDEPVGVILAASHPLAGRTVLQVADLAAETLTIWPRSLSPGFYDRVVEALRAHRFDGPVQEFENLGSGVLFSDPVAEHEVATGRAFTVAFANQYTPLPQGFVWRPMEPQLTVPLHLFWKRPGGAAVRKFVDLAHDIAARESWVDTDDAGGGPHPPPGVPAARRDPSLQRLRDW